MGLSSGEVTLEMNTMKRSLSTIFYTSLLSLLVLPVLQAGEKPPVFTSGPKAAKTSKGAQISFEVSTATDVEVTVLDGQGRVIRHLAAGVLGDKAPAPLLKGLKQSIIWDGSNDLGKAAGPGPFKVRVSLGMKPEFEKIIGSNPVSIARVTALAVGPGGQLYVAQTFGDLHPGDGTGSLMILNRKGNYVRQLLPYPANLPEDQLSGLRRITVAGKKQPGIYQGETRNLFPSFAEIPAQRALVLADATILLTGLDEVGVYNDKKKKGKKVLLAVTRNGGVPSGGAVRGKIAPAGMALDKTGKVFGIVEGNVAIINWKAGTAEIVIKGEAAPQAPRRRKGRKTPPPAEVSAEKKLVGARSVAFDASGNMYVGEYRGVAVFDKAGKRLALLKAQGTTIVSVDPKTGAIYAFKGNWRGGSKLLKFKSRTSTSPVSSYSPKGMGWQSMAIDFSGDKPAIWLACCSFWARERLVRIYDQGDTLGSPVGISALPGNSGETAGPRSRYNMACAGTPMGMALDRKNRILYINQRSYDLKTGKWGRGSLWVDGGKEGVGSFGLDGNFYSQQYSTTLWRMTPDFKPLDFPATEKFREQRLEIEKKMTPAQLKKERIQARKIKLNAVYHPHELGLRRNGITADANGVIYAAVPKPRSERDEIDKGNKRPYELWKIGPDGTIINKRLIACQLPGLYSPRLDYQGNIYVAVSLRPGTQRAPNDLGAGWARPMESTRAKAGEIDWYPLMYGCIMKFGPEGGKILNNAQGPEFIYGPSGKYARKSKVQGAKWTFFGASPLLSWRIPAPNSCLCESPRIDVDGWGRCFFPDACSFRVGILDTAGNLITWLGAYGNLDSAGPGSAIPTPAIPLAWPYLVFAEDGHIYIGDRLNRRTVAVKINYASTKVCSIR
jgi:hypothetical protein